MQRTMQNNAAIDIRPLLADIEAPTLILHRHDEQWLSPDNATYLAERIPGARLVMLPGGDHWPWLGDAAAVLAEVEQFITGRRRSGRAAKRVGVESLTAREREVARLAAAGRSARQVADLLTISERTVESHIASVYRKLGVASRAELARHAELLES